MKPAHMLLAGGMLFAGTINTIVSKLQDTIKSQGLPGTEPKEFNHPAVQTFAMFVGEFLCLIAFRIMVFKNRDSAKYNPNKQDSIPAVFPPYLFLLPSMCDMAGSTLMFIGLLLTYPSVYQMLRGMIVVFTGIFSWLFLGRKLYSFHLLGMFLIIAGTAVVGLTSVLFGSKHKTAPDPLVGDIFVVCAQVVSASQMVIEEKFISKYNVPPLQCVGNEGIWGMSVTAAVLFVLYWVPPVRKIDNSLDAVLQIGNNHFLLLAILASVCSIAFFNYFGISVTKHLSATHRTTIDATRVFLVWIVSLFIGWEKFEYLQLIGFAILLAGTLIFNEIIKIPAMRPPEEKNMQINSPVERKPLLEDN